MSIQEKLQALRITIKGDIRSLILSSHHNYENGTSPFTKKEAVEIIPECIEEIKPLISYYGNRTRDGSDEGDFYADISENIHSNFLLKNIDDPSSHNIIEKLDSLDVTKGADEYIREYNLIIEELLVRYHKALFHVEAEIEEFNSDTDIISQLRALGEGLDDLGREQQERFEIIKDMRDKLKL